MTGFESKHYMALWSCCKFPWVVYCHRSCYVQRCVTGLNPDHYLPPPHPTNNHKHTPVTRSQMLLPLQQPLLHPATAEHSDLFWASGSRLILCHTWTEETMKPVAVFLPASGCGLCWSLKPTKDFCLLWFALSSISVQRSSHGQTPSQRFSLFLFVN